MHLDLYYTYRGEQDFDNNDIGIIGWWIIEVWRTTADVFFRTYTGGVMLNQKKKIRIYHLDKKKLRSEIFYFIHKVEN